MRLGERKSQNYNSLLFILQLLRPFRDKRDKR